MNTAAYAKYALEQTFNLMSAVAEGMDDSQYNWQPGGTCNAIAKSHVHALTSVDFFVNMIAKGGAMTWPEYATKMGLPANPTGIWGFDGQVPLSTMKEYAEQVQASALDYVGALSDVDFDRELETQFFGKQPLAFIIQILGLHSAGHMGDMSAVKGMQSLKGLPF